MSKEIEKTENTEDGLSKKRYPKDDKEQSQRFLETAKDLEVDKTGKGFKKVVDSLKNPKE